MTEAELTKEAESGGGAGAGRGRMEAEECLAKVSCNTISLLCVLIYLIIIKVIN